MKKFFFVVLAALTAQSSMAYLSQDRERLANGAGRCTVCSTGFAGPNAEGNYTCSVPTTVIETGCRPAAFNLAVEPGSGTGASTGGTKFDLNGLVKDVQAAPVRSAPGRALGSAAAAPGGASLERAGTAGGSRVDSTPVQACPPGVQPPCNDLSLPKLPGSPRQ